jgi:RNA polymerase sigma factor (sigma-70 family)
MWKGAISVLEDENYSALGIAVADVVQDTMVTLMDGPGIPSDTRNVAGYLYRAARNGALNAVRREGQLDMDPLAEPGTPGELAADDPGYEFVEDAAILHSINSNLHLLNEDELFAYTQRFKQGRTYAQIGTGLGGKSDRWASRLCAQALRKLSGSAGIELEVEGVHDG